MLSSMWNRSLPVLLLVLTLTSAFIVENDLSESSLSQDILDADEESDAVNTTSTAASSSISSSSQAVNTKPSATSASGTTNAPSTTCDDKQRDIIFLLDASESLTSENFKTMLDFTASLAALFDLADDKTRFGAVVYSSEVVKVFDLHTYTTEQKIREAIQGAPFLEEGTNTTKALRTVVENNLFGTSHGGRGSAVKVLVVVSDGGSHDPNGTRTSAKVLHSSGVQVIFVAVGTKVSAEERRDIASDPSGVINATSFYDLPSKQSDVQKQVCQLSAGKSCTSSADIIFLLDSSDSWHETGFGLEKQFAADLSEMFSLGPLFFRFGAIVFGTQIDKRFDLKNFSDHESLTSALVNSPYLSTGSNTTQALKEIIYQGMFSPAAGARDGTAKIVILITDDSVMPDTLKTAINIRDRGIQIIAIGVSSSANLTELEEITGDPKNVFNASDSSQLHTHLDEVHDRVCEASKLPGGTSCKKVADVVVLLDTSESMYGERFDVQLKFASDVIDRYDVGPTDFRFAAVSYSSSAQVVFHLGKYENKTELEDGLRDTPFLDGGTKFDVALKTVVDQDMFSIANGGRANSVKIILILTDGTSKNLTTAAEAARAVRSRGIQIIAVGYGPDVNETLLKEMTNDNFLQVTNLTQLDTTVQAVNEIICKLDVVVRELCVDNDWADGYYSLPYTCEKYVICKDNKTTIVTCDSGLIYDAQHKSCVQPSPVAWCNISDVSYVCKYNVWGDGLFAHPYDCNLYLNCSSQDTTIENCPTFQSFDPQLKKCGSHVTSTTCHDWQKIDPSKVCTTFNLHENGVYPDPNECSRFITCAAGSSYVYECPDGLRFDTVQRVCEIQSNVDCTKNYGFSFSSSK
ncbi:collagen alpha-6(VI) chain-like isoform X2 [Physella acuta]|uniref:collagen alpha-6(VI) chain-like isoform X2 n=1 Tax=Physella acuta TaxID=109671 RepID=UPI0027DD5EC6|nr:collagen alpha-6(VI) chain-like isoform X2 [Physella acuta]